jgi:hypothetical protein
LLDSGGKVQSKSRRKRLYLWLLLLLALVASLFFFEWLGSEQPLKPVEIEVEPGIEVPPAREAVKD